MHFLNISENLCTHTLSLSINLISMHLSQYVSDFVTFGRLRLNTSLLLRALCDKLIHNLIVKCSSPFLC